MDHLSALAQKNLGDKIADKRKQAAAEVESVVRGMKSRTDTHGMLELAEAIHQRYISNIQQPNMRKGGCLALAAISVALQRVRVLFL